jgi:hypothetical protein
MMDKTEFAEKTTRALNSYASELDAMETAVRKAANAKTGISNAKEIFKEMADASQECGQTIAFYGDNEQIPSEVRVAMQNTQEKLSDCAAAFVLYIAKGGKFTL